MPKRWRSGPERSSSRQSPSVGSPGGSSERRCPCSPSAACSSESRRPASTMHVRSPGSCSRIRPAQKRSASPASSSGCARCGPGHLAAEPRRREELAGVREPGRVECRAQALHRLEIVLAEHQRHRAGLVGADAVLAGDRAAGVDAGLEDLAREQLGALGLAVDAPVVEDERVQVAVARVEDVADAEPVLLRERVDPAQHLRQLRARHDAVLHVVVGADAAHRGEGRLASAPDGRAVGGVGRDPDLGRAVRAAERVDARRGPPRPGSRARRARRSGPRRSPAGSWRRRPPRPPRS